MSVLSTRTYRKDLPSVRRTDLGLAGNATNARGDYVDATNGGTRPVVTQLGTTISPGQTVLITAFEAIQITTGQRTAASLTFA